MSQLFSVSKPHCSERDFRADWSVSHITDDTYGAKRLCVFAFHFQYKALLDMQREEIMKLNNSRLVLSRTTEIIINLST